MASAQAATSGSSRSIAISADVSMIIAAIRAVIKQVTVIHGTERLFQVRRAIFADRQQAICETNRPLTTYAVEALAKGLSDGDGHALCSEPRQFLSQSVCLLALDVQARRAYQSN